MPDSGGIKAGIISKPYGLRGKVNLILESGAGKEIEEGSPLFISIDGQRVPFFAEEVELISDNHAIIKFEFIDSVEEARKMTGCEVFHDPARHQTSPDGSPVHAQVVGYRVVDRELGPVGLITGTLHHEFNPVFLVAHEGKELMIPATDDLIDHIDFHNRTVYFRLPEGLIDL
jgi:16S rRNA processing protein RimM